MLNKTIDVKSNKVVVVKGMPYEEFESIPEAVTFYDARGETRKDKDGNSYAVGGETLILELVNDQHRVLAMNKARVAATRGTSKFQITKQLTEKVEGNPEAKAVFEQLLKMLGIAA